MSQCDSCKAEIIWCRTEKGSSMPVDPEPNKLGPKGEAPRVLKLRVEIDEQGRKSKLVRVLTNRQMEDNTRPLYQPHWVTCPFADEHRRKKK